MGIELPSLGSSRHGRAHVFSLPLKEEFSRMTGVTIEDANYLIDALGAVIQDRLLRGLPSGIPFVGVIHVEFQRDRKFSVKQIAHNPSFPDHNATHITYPVYATPRLYCSRVIRKEVRDNAPYSGNLADMYYVARQNAEEVHAVEKLRKKGIRKRKQRPSVYVHPTNTKEGRRKHDKKFIRDKKRRKKEREDDHKRATEDGIQVGQGLTHGGQFRFGSKAKREGRYPTNQRPNPNSKETKRKRPKNTTKTIT